MDNQTIFMFSGQGSQYYNMGKELFNNDLIFRNHMIKLDEIFGDLTGYSVVEHMYVSDGKPAGFFDDIFYTHPAIFMLEYSLAQTLMEKSVYPEYVLGSSLGEYAACAVAGVIGCEDIVECIVKQVELLRNNCARGGMLAIISDYKIYEELPILHQKSELVSINYVSHFVIAGSEQDLLEIKCYLKKNRIMYVKLPIQYAFHSTLIESIGEEYKIHLKTKNYKTSQIGLISCMKGGLINNIDYEHLWKVVRKPIDFIGAIKCLGENGNFNYVDLGPSGTMANFTKYHIPKERLQNVYPIVTPAHKEFLYINKLCESFEQIAY